MRAYVIHTSDSYTRASRTQLSQFENNDPLDSDDGLYDDVTNTDDIEERNEMFGASDSDGENDFEGFE